MTRELLQVGDVVTIDPKTIGIRLAGVKFYDIYRLNDITDRSFPRHTTHKAAELLGKPAIVIQSRAFLNTYMGILPGPDLCIVTFVDDGYEWYVPQTALIVLNRNEK